MSLDLKYEWPATLWRNLDQSDDEPGAQTNCENYQPSAATSTVQRNCLH